MGMLRRSTIQTIGFVDWSAQAPASGRRPGLERFARLLRGGALILALLLAPAAHIIRPGATSAPATARPRH